MELWIVFGAWIVVFLAGLAFIFLPLIPELNKPKPTEVDPDDVAVKLLGADDAAEYRRQARRRQAIARARARRLR